VRCGMCVGLACPVDADNGAHNTTVLASGLTPCASRCHLAGKGGPALRHSAPCADAYRHVVRRPGPRLRASRGPRLLGPRHLQGGQPPPSRWRHAR